MELPGEASHYKMTPLQRRYALETINIKEKNPKKAAVLSLFYPDNDGNARFILILRKVYKGIHSNQVGFPGGKEEHEDHGLHATALRETEEEVGIDAAKIRIIKKLSEVYIPPSNFMVYPYLGLLNETPQLIPDKMEVEAILEVLVSDLLDDDMIFNKRLTTSYAEDIEVPAFKLNDHTVWGATAMMLSEVKEIIKSANYQ